MVVQSFGTLQTYRNEREVLPDTSWRRSNLWAAGPQTYAAMYRTQPSVRTVVDFIARNVAQLGIHIYRRISDIDRERLANHELAQWLKNPNPGMTQHRLIESLMQDLGVYFMAYWLKVRERNGRLGLVRLPPETVTVHGWLVPEAFDWTLPDNTIRTLRPQDLVYFHGYDPCDPLSGISPLETLRRTLEGESAAGSYMSAFWENAARLEGVIQRPATAPKWTPEQKQSFREQWQTRFQGPANAGQTAVLEDGMTFQATSYSAKDSEYTDARKLSREEVAREYHVPLPMVGILDHATYSNIREQHKNLYQDCLGPWLDFIEQELTKQLLIECSDQDGVYIEFNIAEKLKGSFEEQAAAMQTAVGRPVMTVNEGRARLNLPSIKNDTTANQVALPLNMSPTGEDVEPQRALMRVPGVTAAIARAWRRQASVVAKGLPFDADRWNTELAADLEEALIVAGGERAQSAEAAASLACHLNSETQQLLADGSNPFTADREAALYV
jgi:HK97 family phage portal protein